MGEKIWLSMHPINFGYDKIVRTYAEVKFRISSTPHVSAINCMATHTFQEKEMKLSFSFDQF